MPDKHSGDFSLGTPIPGKHIIVAYTASYQINGGTDITSGASITDSVTFTGVAVGDKIAIACREAARAAVPSGLQLESAKVTATNTVALKWTNNSSATVTPGASATWTCGVIGLFFN
jgi:hypothetical protein